MHTNELSYVIVGAALRLLVGGQLGLLVDEGLGLLVRAPWTDGTDSHAMLMLECWPRQVVARLSAMNTRSVSAPASSHRICDR